jgi:hypothetical protein
LKKEKRKEKKKREALRRTGLAWGTTVWHTARRVRKWRTVCASLVSCELRAASSCSPSNPSSGSCSRGKHVHECHNTFDRNDQKIKGEMVMKKKMITSFSGVAPSPTV